MTLILLLGSLFTFAQTTENQLKLAPAPQTEQTQADRGEGLLRTHWTQNSPYNDMCPRDPSTGSSSYAGCPAVAAPSLDTYYAMSCPFAIESELATAENTLSSQISIYPNPSDGHFTIEAEGMKHIEIFNALGQCIKAENVDNKILEINLGNVHSGIYLIRIFTETEIISKSVCVQ